MRVNFIHRHVKDTMVILEEGNLPHPRFPQCNMLVPWRALKKRHLATTQCAMRAERNIIQLAQEELREISEKYFQAYVEPLQNVTVFMYLGRVMTVGDDEWPVVVGNLHKSRKCWGRLLRILS